MNFVRSKKKQTSEYCASDVHVVSVGNTLLPFLSQKLEFWNLNIEIVMQQLTENISLLVGRQEMVRTRAIELHDIVEAKVSKALALITAARQAAHEEIEVKSKCEMDSLQCYLHELEQSLEIFHEQNDNLSVVLASVNSNNSDSITNSGAIGLESTNLLKLTAAKTQSLRRIKDHIETVRVNLIFLHTKTAIGHVTMTQARFDELHALLSRGKLFTVNNESMLGGPIPRKEDAFVMFMNIFERLGICEECLESSGNGGESKSVQEFCLSCGFKLRNGQLIKYHTINRGAGILDGRGSTGGGVMSYPRGVALITTDTDKLLFVSDANNNSIKVYDSETGRYLRTLTNQFNRPECLASLYRNDIATELLLVSDYSNRVQLIDVSHGDAVKGCITVKGLQGLAVMECQVNEAIVHYMYVSSNHSNQVLVYDVSTMTSVNTIGMGQLKFPRGLALLPGSASDLPESRLFVCDLGNYRIQVIDAFSGVFISTIGSQSLQCPYGVTMSSSLDHSSHMLIVSDYVLHKLFLFDAITGESMRSIGSHGSAIDQFNHPYDVTAIRNDNDHIIIYTADPFNHRVQITVV